jgi:hypothetical protein
MVSTWYITLNNTSYLKRVSTVAVASHSESCFAKVVCGSPVEAHAQHPTAAHKPYINVMVWCKGLNNWQQHSRIMKPFCRCSAAGSAGPAAAAGVGVTLDQVEQALALFNEYLVHVSDLLLILFQAITGLSCMCTSSSCS